MRKFCLMMLAGCALLLSGCQGGKSDEAAAEERRVLFREQLECLNENAFDYALYSDDAAEIKRKTRSMCGSYEIQYVQTFPFSMHDQIRAQFEPTFDKAAGNATENALKKASYKKDYFSRLYDCSIINTIRRLDTANFTSKNELDAFLTSATTACYDATADEYFSKNKNKYGLDRKKSIITGVKRGLVQIIVDNSIEALFRQAAKRRGTAVPGAPTTASSGPVDESKLREKLVFLKKMAADLMR